MLDSILIHMKVIHTKHNLICLLDYYWILSLSFLCNLLFLYQIYHVLGNFFWEINSGIYSHFHFFWCSRFFFSEIDYDYSDRCCSSECPCYCTEYYPLPLLWIISKHYKHVKFLLHCCNICMSPNTVPDDICLRTHNQTVASFETLEMINTLEKKYPSWKLEATWSQTVTLNITQVLFLLCFVIS